MSNTADIPVETWHGCYEDGWRDYIVPDAFVHPAKFAKGLVERIIRDGLERGYFRPGDVIGDPFGGIGTGGIIAAYAGLRWVGVELEAKFHALAQQNFEKHRRALEGFGDPMPVMLNGDSRRFAELVAPVAAVVTSPPYANSIEGRGDGIDWDKTCQMHRGSRTVGRGAIADGYGASPVHLDAVLTSPPYADAGQGGGADSHPERCEGSGKSISLRDGYGGTPGQIGDLRPGNLDAVLASPPYAESLTPGNKDDSREHRQDLATAAGHGKIGGGQLAHGTRYSFDPVNIGNLKSGELDAVMTSPPYADGLGHGLGRPDNTLYIEKRLGSQVTDQHGDADGQIGNLRTGDLAAVVTSPPYEDSVNAAGHGIDWTKAGPATGSRKRGEGCRNEETLRGQLAYGDTEGQIGAEAGETYWQAMKAVYGQCLLALKPGGVMYVVLKDFVKDGKRVPLCDQSCQLLASLGFRVHRRIRAMLVSERREPTLFGGEHVKRTERKSFFRRLHEAKGAPRIDWEDVVVVRKPSDHA